ncbi:hypothetical protein [Aeromonas veronii]|uniref:hypothetical protein n=2 Tax=Aeromonas TaxID=642 RepID=UPI00041DABD3|nr:hypothetical protein [Aeromonas veronii]QMS78789.1 hypothetical protein M001_021985 [Aeromonas veronii Hm21]
MMKSEQEIRNKIAELEADERLHYPAASVFSNAPLALIQTDIRGQLKALHFALGLSMPEYHHGKKELKEQTA